MLRTLTLLNGTCSKSSFKALANAVLVMLTSDTDTSFSTVLRYCGLLLYSQINNIVSSVKRAFNALKRK